MHDWTETQGTLTRRFTFNNFADALAFVNKVGALAEEVNHHPNITLQNYNEVLIETTTHDAGNTITEKDRTLVERVNLLY